jgi:hypothetical protein
LGRPVDVKSVLEGTVSITGRDQYAFNAKDPRDKDGNDSNGKYKKPKPRSSHGRDDDKP